MEDEYEVVTREVVLVCNECKILMKEYNPYIYFTNQYYYECPQCKKNTITKKRYPYIKHVRKTDD